MNKLLLIPSLLSLSILVSCSAGAPKGENAAGGPSSAIPERREFPVNPSIKPCDDFYQYACSEVDASFKLRDDRSAHDFAFNDSAERLLDAKEKFMAKLGAETYEPLNVKRRMLKDVYNACMDEEGSKKEERFFVDKISNEVKTIGSRPKFLEFLAKNVVSKDDGFIDFDTTADMDNPDTSDIILTATLQNLPERSYYDNPELMAEYEGIATDFFKLIGRDKPEERAKAVVKFERDFAQTFPLPAEFRELFNSKRLISRKDLIAKFPNLRFQQILARAPGKNPIRNITPDNFAFLNKALGSLPVETLKDIYLFQIVPNYMDDAYPDFFKRRFDFDHKFLGGPPVRPVRVERCTKMIMSSFTKEIDFLLLPQLFPDFPSERVDTLVEKVRDSIIEGVKNNGWLSEQGKAEAIKKMKTAHLQLVKPRNDREWDFTPPADYSATERYANARTLKYNLLLKKLRELKPPRDRTRWDMGPLTINAYYDPSDNKFVLPIGILQYPFFDEKLSDQENLGALGAVAGHELGHGIDDKGSRYDETGRFREWMTPADLEHFKGEGTKFGQQFAAVGLNPELTMGENTADNVGINAAYNAAFPDDQGPQELKKGFFLQFARLWCNVMRPKMHEMMIKTNPHSPGEWRTDVQVKNQFGFDEAYQCKAGDKMYLPPEERVRIW